MTTRSSLLQVTALLVGLGLVLLLLRPWADVANSQGGGSTSSQFLPMMFTAPPLLNGSFSNGSFGGWTVSTSGPTFKAQVVNVGNNFHALLGDPDAGCNGGAPKAGASGFYQTIRVPQWNDVAFSMRYRVLSQDDQRFEKLRVVLRDAQGVTLTPLLEVGSPEATRCEGAVWDSGWQTRRFSLDPYVGQTIQIYVELETTDSSGFFNSWAFVDDFVLTGIVPSPTATGTPTMTATPTQTATPTVTPTATPDPMTTHIGDLEGFSTLTGGAQWEANVAVLVHNGSDAEVANALVSGTWSSEVGGSTPGSCTTDSSGRCTLQTGEVLPRNLSSVTFTVESVTLPDYPYRPSDNHDTDGDSDGTTVTVVRE